MELEADLHVSEAHLRQKVLAYRPSAEALEPIRKTPLVFMVGIAGAGKNAILHGLLKKYPNDYHLMVSHTTRAPRQNNGVMERNGVEYHFIGLQELDRMLGAQEFIEVQPVHAHFYGSSITEVIRAEQEDRIAVNDIDIQGIEQYVEMGLNVKPIFILPPNYDIWHQRFISRYGVGGNVDREDLKVRVRSAIREIEYAMTSGYFYIVINDDLEKTVELVDQIARGEAVDPHHPKAMDIAQKLLDRLREEFAQMV